MNTKFAKGNKVMIYCDPITCQKEEGPAVLHALLDDERQDGLEYWSVSFLGERHLHERLIRADQQVLNAIR